jgi:hypothetical protein
MIKDFDNQSLEKIYSKISECERISDELEKYNKYGCLKHTVDDVLKICKSVMDLESKLSKIPAGKFSIAKNLHTQLILSIADYQSNLDDLKRVVIKNKSFPELFCVSRKYLIFCYKGDFYQSARLKGDNVLLNPLYNTFNDYASYPSNYYVEPDTSYYKNLHLNFNSECLDYFAKQISKDLINSKLEGYTNTYFLNNINLSFDSLRTQVSLLKIKNKNAHKEAIHDCIENIVKNLSENFEESEDLLRHVAYTHLNNLHDFDNSLIYTL